MTFKTVDFSAVLKFLWEPLDFLGKNSYYLSVGSKFSFLRFWSSAGKALVTESKYIYSYEGGIQNQTLAREILCPMALRTDSRCGTIDSILFRVSARISEQAGHGM